jgi:hypothetical protein
MGTVIIVHTFSALAFPCLILADFLCRRVSCFDNFRGVLYWSLNGVKHALKLPRCLIRRLVVLITSEAFYVGHLTELSVLRDYQDACAAVRVVLITSGMFCQSLNPLKPCDYYIYHPL